MPTQCVNMDGSFCSCSYGQPQRSGIMNPNRCIFDLVSQTWSLTLPYAP
jgi:hypothetical protein